MDKIALLQSILVLFAIVNPIGSIPIFLQLTSHLNSKARRQSFQTAILSSATILFVFALAGEKILTNLFRIEFSDLLAAGGLLLLIIAIDHLVFGGLMSSVMKSDAQDAHHIGAVPMSCPILAGPGAMMTVLVIYVEHGLMIAACSIIIVLGLTGLILLFIDHIDRFLGKIVCLVLSKILCLFLAAIGIKFLMQGISHYF